MCSFFTAANFHQSSCRTYRVISHVEKTSYWRLPHPPQRHIFCYLPQRSVCITFTALLKITLQINKNIKQRTMETFAPDFPILPAGDSPSLSFSEMLNQTSSNFEYNVNSVSVSPTPCSFIDSDTSELVTKRDQTFVSCKIHFLFSRQN